MKQLRKKIEFCLRKYPDTRNSDIKLTNSIWYEFFNSYLKTINGKTYIALLDLYEVPREDDCKRIRAKIQNVENKYLPTSKEIAKQRRINEDKWRAYMGYDNPAMG